MGTVWKIERDGGSGGFMNPPGDPAHTYSVVEYSSSRHNARMLASMNLESAATEDYVPEHIRKRAAEILATATRIPSELWVQSVYGYFRGMYAPNGETWTNAGDLLSAREADQPYPAEWHAGYVWVKKFFPDHEPRTDLIADSGKGYGSYACVKCGERVQYEARLDALAIVSTRLSGSGITQWSYITECTTGGVHAV
jgi:hypothetical protein